MAVINGTPNDDQDGAALVGTVDADEYFGLAGNDQLISSAGDDTLDGGDGQDTVDYTADPGPVSINLITGTVTNGFGGTDTLIGIERARGSDGFGDTIVAGGFDNAVASGFGGNDTLTADNPNLLTQLYGGEGDDQIIGLSGIVYLDPGSGTDTITGDANGATYMIITYYWEAIEFDPLPMVGIVANYTSERSGTVTDYFGSTDTFTSIDEIRGTQEADTFNGTIGRQSFTGYGGNDTFNGGEGDDLVNYLRENDTGLQTQGITVNLATGMATDSFGDADTLQGIEDIRGTDFGDTIIGDDADNDLRGEGGDDSIVGGDGRDELTGGAGDDTLDGGAGDRDRAIYREASAGVEVNLTTGVASDGDGGTDTLLNIEEIRGSNFNDTLTGSDSSDFVSRLRGEGGDDLLMGNRTAPGFGTDIDGGSGNDTLVSVGGDSFLQPGTGDDSITGSASGFDTVSYFFSAGYASPAPVNGVSFTFTSEGVGTATDEQGGNDTFTGIERAEGTMLADTFTGAAGFQDFRGFAGNDTIDGGADFDRVDYSANRSDFGGTTGNGVVVDLGAGTATDNYGDTDTLSNIEAVRGSVFDDDITGDGEDNRFEGRDGNDTLSGVDGDDTLRGEGGNDSLFGGDGRDQLNGGSGDDTLDGGTGDRDQAYYRDDGAGVTVDLGAGTATDGSGATDTLINIEEVEGSNFDDTLQTGTDAVDYRLFGGAGNDTLTNVAGQFNVFNNISYLEGGEGDDTLLTTVGNVSFRPGVGNDTVTGTAEGFDILTYTYDAAEAETPPASGINVAATSGGSGTLTDFAGGTDTFTDIDIIEATMLADTLTGGDGNQRFRGHGGNDTIDGGAGDGDFADYSRPRSDLGSSGLGITVDLVAGSAIDGYGDTDTLISIERIRGTNFDDQVIGDDANNRFEGESGDDTLDGGAGSDTLEGGSGADTFVIGTGNDQVLITDFELGIDTLDLTAFARADALNALANAAAGSAVLTFGDGTVVTVDGDGVTPQSLMESDLALAPEPNNDPTGAVTIDGDPTEGETLTANISTVADADGIQTNTIAYQWQRDGVDIAGATDASYVLTADDVGADVTVTLFFTDNGNTDEMLTSAAVVPQAGNAEPTGAVTIDGTTTEGETLTANISAVADPDGIQTNTIAYQWQRDGVDIAGATAASYVLTTDDVGTDITVILSFTDDGNTDEMLSSASVTPKAAPVVEEGDDTNNTLTGGDGDDMLSGKEGDDTLTGGAGDDDLDGGPGIDTAQYSGSQASYTLTLSPTATTLTDRRVDGNGTDMLTAMEFLDFDTDLLGAPFDLQRFGGPAGLDAADLQSFIELYIAYFNRAPDAVGLNFWGTAFANGTTLEGMAALFNDQPETTATYPDTLTNAQFATEVYNNVLGRIPDQAGFDFWVRVLDDGSVSRDQFILSVLEGAKADPPAGADQAFIDQQLADRQYLSDKTDIGAYFAVHKGMSDTDNASSAMNFFDGTQSGIDAAVAAIDMFFADAQDPDTGEFLMPLIGVLDDPFAL